MYTIKKEGTQVEIALSVDSAEWEAAVQKVYEADKGKFNITGFRKGHAPRKVIEKTYGDNVFFEDTVEYFVNTTINEVLSQDPTLEPVDSPRTQFESYTADGGLKIKIFFDIVPEFKLCPYTGNNIEVHDATPTQDEIDYYINQLLDQNAKYEIVDRPIENGDVAIIDFIGFMDGKEFQGGSAQNYSLEIGSHSFVDNFEEQLVGHSKGEEVDVNVTFPEDYFAEEIKGKKVEFKVTIKEVKKKTVPTLDDKFISNATEFDTVEEYRKDLIAHIETMKKNDQESEFEYNIRHFLADNTEIQFPDGMVERYVDYELDNLRHALKPYNISLEQYVMQTGGKTLEEFIESIKHRVLTNVKARYIYRKIIEREHIEVPPEELAAATKGLSYKESVEKENTMALERVNEFLKAHNNRVIVPEEE